MKTEITEQQVKDIIQHHRDGLLPFAIARKMNQPLKVIKGTNLSKPMEYNWYATPWHDPNDPIITGQRNGCLGWIVFVIVAAIVYFVLGN